MWYPNDSKWMVPCLTLMFSLVKRRDRKDKMDIKQQSAKAVRHHLNNMERLREEKPTGEELKEMYGYLSYCWACEKKFLFAEQFTHSFEGNCHKFGCSILARGFGYIYFPISTIIKLPFMIIIGIFGGLIWGVKALLSKVLRR